MILGNTIFRLNLECLFVWARKYPQSKFEQKYKQLCEMGVTFPREFNYFEVKDQESKQGNDGMSHEYLENHEV